MHDSGERLKLAGHRDPAGVQVETQPIFVLDSLVLANVTNNPARYEQGDTESQPDITYHQTGNSRGISVCQKGNTHVESCGI